MKKPTDQTKKEKVEGHRIVANCWLQDFKDFEKLKDDEGMPVLILGETGTGKELIAKHVHILDRPEGPFVPVNCALIDKEKMESKLFGHMKGAFTGAAVNQKGAFQEAEGGTLFLDEFQELCGPAQASLLRAVEQREVKKLGSNKPEPVRCRIILASSKDLSSEDTIRQDLYYRVNRFQIFLPTLYSRDVDVLILTRHFIERFNKDIKTIPGELLIFIMTWRWHGNVRELLNFLYYLCKLADEDGLDFFRTGQSEFSSLSAFGRLPKHPKTFWFGSRLRSIEKDNPRALKKVVNHKQYRTADFVPEDEVRSLYGDTNHKTSLYDKISLEKLPQFSSEELLDKWGRHISSSRPPLSRRHFEILRHWNRKIGIARELMRVAERRHSEMLTRMSTELVRSQNPMTTFGSKFPDYDEAKKAFDNQYISELRQRHGPHQQPMADIAGKERRWISGMLKKLAKD